MWRWVFLVLLIGCENAPTPLTLSELEAKQWSIGQSVTVQGIVSHSSTRSTSTIGPCTVVDLEEGDFKLRAVASGQLAIPKGVRITVSGTINTIEPKYIALSHAKLMSSE